MLKFSRLFKARPPDTTLPADDRSGLDDTVNSSEMYLVDASGQLGLITRIALDSCRLTICTGSVDLLDRSGSSSNSSLVESGRADSDDLDLVLWRRLDLKNSISSIDWTGECISRSF